MTGTHATFSFSGDQETERKDVKHNIEILDGKFSKPSESQKSYSAYLGRLMRKSQPH